jgi:hypothetical protein
MFPQRLKPREMRLSCGTAEALPFQNQLQGRQLQRRAAPDARRWTVGSVLPGGKLFFFRRFFLPPIFLPTIFSFFRRGFELGLAWGRGICTVKNVHLFSWSCI